MVSIYFTCTLSPTHLPSFSHTHTHTYTTRKHLHPRPQERAALQALSKKQQEAKKKITKEEVSPSHPLWGFYELYKYIKDAQNDYSYIRN